MLDQFNHLVNVSSLTLLDLPASELTMAQVQKIRELKWYVFNNDFSRIFVDNGQLNKIMDDEIEYIQPAVKGESVVYVPLEYRGWTSTSGFSVD